MSKNAFVAGFVLTLALCACGGGQSTSSSSSSSASGTSGAIQALAAAEDNGFGDQRTDQTVSAGGATLYNIKTSVPGMTCQLLSSHGISFVTCVSKAMNQHDGDAAFSEIKQSVAQAMPGMTGSDITSSAGGKYQAAYLYSDGKRAILVGETKKDDGYTPTLQFMPAALFQAK